MTLENEPKTLATRDEWHKSKKERLDAYYRGMDVS